MNTEKRQRIYKTIMLVFIVAIVTFLITTIYMYKSLENEGKYIYVTAKDDAISTTLASFRKLIDKKYLGEVDNDKMLEGAIKGYVEGLGDPYSEYITKEEMEEYKADILGNFTGIGIYMTNNIKDNTILVISPIKGSPAEAAGIKAGDIISKVNGVAYRGEELSEASSKIKGEEGTKVKLEIIRDGKSFEVEIERKSIKANHVEGEVLNNNIGYLIFNTFDEGCAKEFQEQYEAISKNNNLKGLIIDIRNNGGGLVDEAINILELICNKDSTLLITTDKNKKEEITKSKKNPIINLPIVVLTNEGTASASEILAGALKDNGKAKIVGTKTYGKGVIQELLTLQDGSGLKITTNEYFTPNRNKINKIGIQPDYEVELPKEETNNGTTENDVQLQKAIEVLK